MAKLKGNLKENSHLLEFLNSELIKEMGTNLELTSISIKHNKTKCIFRKDPKTGKIIAICK